MMASPMAPPRLRIRLKRPLAFGTRAGVEAAERQCRARQQAQHDCGTPRQLLPEQPPEIGRERHKAVAEPADAPSSA